MMHSVDTAALKQQHPVAEVIARYGIDLRSSGRALVGRCPFHRDQGQPNLHVYPFSASWYCYRCAMGGDVIRFVERLEGIGFREAVARILGTPATSRRYLARLSPERSTRAGRGSAWGPDERACLAAAADIYHSRLLGDPTAIAYVAGRGIDQATIERCHLGYASGDELAAFLRWRRLPLGAARRVGLLRQDGREFLARRVVVPEIRSGQPIWLVGRTIESDGDAPKYLGLPGPKPLLGWEFAASRRDVWIVEGVFDYLTLRSWGIPALALVGTRARAETLDALGRFTRIYLALDNDPAGRVATAHLIDHLGPRAIPVTLTEVKDVAELAVQRNGRETLLAALDVAPLAA
jgi:DNA primase